MDKDAVCCERRFSYAEDLHGGELAHGNLRERARHAFVVRACGK